MASAADRLRFHGRAAQTLAAEAERGLCKTNEKTQKMVFRVYGGLPYHAKGYVDAAAAGRSIHFINYDRLKQDPEGEIRKLAQYTALLAFRRTV